MPLWFKRNKAQMMKSVKTAGKRQADRCKVMGAGKEWQGTKERKRERRREDEVSVLQGTEVKLVCRKLRWRGRDSDRCSMCWCLKRDHRVEILWKHTQRARRHMYTHTHKHTLEEPYLKAKEMKWEKRKKKRRHLTYFLSNKCHRRHSAYFFPAYRDPRGPWEMNICPIDLSHLIQSWSALLRWKQSHSLCTLKVIG